MLSYKKILVGLAVMASLSGCVTIDSIFGEADAPISSVELQALQTREFEATEEQAFSAVIGTFQDYGYTVNSADRATGLIIAKTTSDAEIMVMTGVTRVEYNKATAFIEKVAQGRVKIRVSIVKYVSAKNAYGGGGEKEVVRTKPEMYKEIFSKIEQSLFLKKNL